MLRGGRVPRSNAARQESPSPWAVPIWWWFRLLHLLNDVENSVMGLGRAGNVVHHEELPERALGSCESAPPIWGGETLAGHDELVVDSCKEVGEVLVVATWPERPSGDPVGVRAWCQNAFVGRDKGGLEIGHSVGLNDGRERGSARRSPWRSSTA